MRKISRSQAGNRLGDITVTLSKPQPISRAGIVLYVQSQRCSLLWQHLPGRAVVRIRETVSRPWLAVLSRCEPSPTACSFLLHHSSIH